ncbi:MAG: hypothetical protein ABIR80_07045, partial [Opitutaceae bacterium]
IPVAEENKLNEDVAALARLKAELKAIQTNLQTDGMNSLPIARALPPRAWVDAGSALPSAALETILWAAFRGEIGTLAEMLVFSPEARAKVEGIFAELGESEREKYPSPEHLVATFTAQDVPHCGVVFSGSSGGVEKMNLHIKFRLEVERELWLDMIRTPAGWRLAVPVSAVEKYGAMLKAAGAR